MKNWFLDYKKIEQFLLEFWRVIWEKDAVRNVLLDGLLFFIHLTTAITKLSEISLIPCLALEWD